MGHNKQIKRGKWNSNFPYWKKVGAHNCRLNSSLKIGFGWLMDTQKMTVVSKKFNIMKCPLLYIHHFFQLKWLKQAFFQPTTFKNDMWG